MTRPGGGLRGRAGELMALAAILVVGLLLRTHGLSWGGTLYLHPDERFQTQVVTRIRWPDGIAGYFDSARSPLNPYNNEFGSYIYGDFPLLLAKLLGSLTGNEVYGNAHLPGRALSTGFDLLSVALVYVVGRRLFDARVGLVGAALLATTVMHVQASHFFGPDTAATALCLGTFALALRAGDGGGRRWFAAAGVVAGLAVASKVSALPVAGFLALPALESLRRAATGGAPWRAVRRPLIGLAIAAVAALWTFRVAMPYAFQGPSPLSFRLDPRWVADVRFWRDVQSGIGDTPPSIQWADRAPVLFSLRNLVLWGMGPLLGAAAVAALALGGVSMLARRRLPAMGRLMVVGWPAVHLLYYGSGFVKTMRYLLPAYPFLVLLAAALLVAVVDAGRERGWGSISILRPPDRVPVRLPVAALPAALVIASTLIYAVGFAGIYGRPTTREAASRWIYANVPAGATIASEHWDDGLPVPLPGLDYGVYRGVQLELFFADDEVKLERLTSQLDAIDVIVLSSNRLYATIPRIPEKFPMTSAYYEMLFDGRLGYDLVHVETSYPSYLGVELNDDRAEEAFTVYDHPKVLVFRKTVAYDPTAIRTELGAALAPGAYPIWPIHAGEGLLLMDEGTRASQQASGTWSRMFDPGSLANRWPAPIWLLALQLMALAAVPLCWRVFTGLPDRGYAVAKTVGMLTVSYVPWLLASLGVVSFGPDAVVLGIVATGGLSALALRGRGRRFRQDMRARWRSVVATEVVYLTAFLGMLALRAQNPDLWNRYRGGEKPMDFAYLNAVLRSTSFPPYDPWFAGGRMNYYYFGFVEWAAPTRLTGIVPEVAYTLAIASIFALLCVNVWSLAATALARLGRSAAGHGWRPLLLALPAPLLVCSAGNLDLALRVGRGELGYPKDPLRLHALLPAWPADLLTGIWSVARYRPALPDDAYWASSRVIDGTINEFPLFSFLLGDLHAHVMALPLASAALLAAMHLLGRPRPAAGARAWERWSLADLGMAALLTGALFATNGWDFPTYLVVVGAAYVAMAGNAVGWRVGYRWAVRTGAWLAGLAVVGRLLFLPFAASFHTGPVELHRLAGDSPIGDYLTIHGVFALALAWMVARARPWAGMGGAPSGRGLRSTLAGGTLNVSVDLPAWRDRLPAVATGLIGVMGGVGILAGRLDLLLTAALGVIAVALWRGPRGAGREAPLLLGAAGLGVSLLVEHVVVGGDIGRMNTGFKSYVQVWLMLGVAGSVAAAWLVSTWWASARRGKVGPATAAGLLGVLVAASVVYPVVAIQARSQDRFAELPATLDGMAYLTSATYDDAPEGREPVSFSLDGDALAIDWLRTSVLGSPVVLEASIPGYRWGSRVSVYTGLPTVLGWDWHQTQQRPGFGDMVAERRDHVQRMLGEAVGFDEVRPLLERYHVRLIYVGALERAYYPAAGLAKFEEAAAEGLLTVVYQREGVVIYGFDG